MNQFEAALVAKLKAASLSDPVAGGTVSVYAYQAPQNTSPPYVVVFKQSNVPVYTMGGTAFENALYGVKAVARGPSMAQAGSIAKQIDAALNDQELTITGYTLMRCYRVSDIAFVETADGQRWDHNGGSFRIMADPT